MPRTVLKVEIRINFRRRPRGLLCSACFFLGRLIRPPYNNKGNKVNDTRYNNRPISGLLNSRCLDFSDDNTLFYNETSRDVRAVNRPHLNSSYLPTLGRNATVIAIQT